MIEKYTIKFVPTVSQMELEKALHEKTDRPALTKFHKKWAPIEVVCDDIKKLDSLLNELSSK